MFIAPPLIPFKDENQEYLTSTFSTSSKWIPPVVDKLTFPGSPPVKLEDVSCRLVQRRYIELAIIPLKLHPVITSVVNAF